MRDKLRELHDTAILIFFILPALWYGGVKTLAERAEWFWLDAHPVAFCAAWWAGVVALVVWIVWTVIR